jgi:hypothetical protein
MMWLSSSFCNEEQYEEEMMWRRIWWRRWYVMIWPQVTSFHPRYCY